MEEKNIPEEIKENNDIKQESKEVKEKPKTNNKIFVFIILILLVAGTIFWFYQREEIEDDKAIETFYNNTLAVNNLTFNATFDETAYTILYDIENQKVKFENEEEYYYQVKDDEIFLINLDNNNFMKETLLDDSEKEKINALLPEFLLLKQFEEHLHLFEEKEDNKFFWSNEEVLLNFINYQFNPETNEKVEIILEINDDFINKIEISLYQSEKITIILEIKNIDDTEITIPEISDFDLTPEKRMELILHLLEYDAFAIYDYDNVTDVPASIVAWRFSRDTYYQQFNAEETAFIEDNYETNEWYQMGGLGEFENYIPAQLIEDYFQAATGINPTNYDNEICMIYIEEYQAFVPVCGHGLISGSVEYLSFGHEGSSWLHYVDNVVALEDNHYLLEVYDYYWYPNEQDFINLDEAKAVYTNFILDGIIDDDLEKDPQKISYTMKKVNDDWLFVSRSSEN